MTYLEKLVYEVNIYHLKFNKIILMGLLRPKLTILQEQMHRNTIHTEGHRERINIFKLIKCILR